MYRRTGEIPARPASGVVKPFRSCATLRAQSQSPKSARIAAVRRTVRISRSEWERRAAPARDRIFASLDPYGEPFTAAAKERAVLFPISYELEAHQLAVLRRAARSVGDETFFVESLVAGDEGAHWEVPVRDKRPYKRMDVVAETAIFSPSGRWGLLISDEDHAVIGGSHEFMAVVAARLRPTKEPTQHYWAPAHDPLAEAPADASFDELFSRLTSASTPIPMRSGEPFGDGQALAFVEFWRIHRERLPAVGDWLPSLFVHIYGEEHARRLLQAGGW